MEPQAKKLVNKANAKVANVHLRPLKLGAGGRREMALRLSKSKSPPRPKTPLDVHSKLQAKDVKNYGADIAAYLAQLEAENLVGNCLEKTTISHAYRAKMIDWMVEVLSAFKCGENTFFMTVSLMDRFFKASPGLESRKLHLVGISCMFIASKYEDIYPLMMKTMVNKIAHNKYNEDEI